MGAPRYPGHSPDCGQNEGVRGLTWHAVALLWHEGGGEQLCRDGLREGSVNVLLDPEGDEWTSALLAKHIEQWQNSGTKELTFIVGGPNGVSAALAARAHKRWSLSRLTLTHEMARVLLLEQLYRAFTIIHGLPYQK